MICNLFTLYNSSGFQTGRKYPTIESIVFDLDTQKVCVEFMMIDESSMVPETKLIEMTAKHDFYVYSKLVMLALDDRLMMIELFDHVQILTFEKGVHA